MIQVGSSDQLMQSTGQGDAYVYKPMNTDLYKFHEQIKQQKELKAEVIKAKRAKDLEHRLTFDPLTSTPEHTAEHEASFQATLAKKQEAIYGEDPTGELTKEFDVLAANTRRIANQSKIKAKELELAHREIQGNPLVNQSEAYKTLVSLTYNEDNSVKPVADWKQNTSMTSVYANPNAVNVQGLFEVAAKNAAKQVSQYATSVENGDKTTKQMNEEMGKFLVPILDANGNIISFKKGKDGQFEYDVNPETVKMVANTYSNNPETGMKALKLNHQKVLAERGLDPKDYTEEDFVEEGLRQFVSTSSKKRRDSEDKASVRVSKDGSYGDASGLTITQGPFKHLSIIAQNVKHNAAGQYLGESESTEEGIGFGSAAIAVKGKQLTIDANNIVNLWDGNTATKKDTKNYSNQKFTIGEVTYLLVDRKTGSLLYRAQKRKQGETDEDWLARNEEWAAKNNGQYKLMPFVTVGSQEETGTANDGSVNDTAGAIDKKREGQNKSKGIYYVPFSELETKLLAAAGGHDTEKTKKSLLYSKSKQRIDKKVAEYATKGYADQKAKEKQNQAKPNVNTPAKKPLPKGKIDF